MNRIPIISIDAAFANVGIALGHYDIATHTLTFDRLELIQTQSDSKAKKTVRKNSDDLRRAREILTGVGQCIESHRPLFAFCEVPTGTQSARSSWALGIAVGLIASVSMRVNLVEVSQQEVKKVVNDRFPDKAHMIAWAVNKHPELNWPRSKHKGEMQITSGKAEHQADAVAAAYAGIETPHFRGIVNAAAAFIPA